MHVHNTNANIKYTLHVHVGTLVHLRPNLFMPLDNSFVGSKISVKISFGPYAKKMKTMI